MDGGGVIGNAVALRAVVALEVRPTRKRAVEFIACRDEFSGQSLRRSESGAAKKTEVKPATKNEESKFD